MVAWIARAGAAWALAGLAPAALGAQETGTLFTFATEEAVHLRWNAPRERPYDGFHVERRRSPAGEWERLTPELVERIEEVAEIRRLLGARAEAFLAFFGDAQRLDAAAYTRAFRDPFGRAMIDRLSVQVPELGWVLGERFEDRELEAGTAFDYRVRIVRLGGPEATWATSPAPVQHGEAETVPVPQDVEGRPGDRSARLGWRHDEAASHAGRLTGYRVYRAERPLGPFVPASLEAVVPTRVEGALPEDLFVDRFLDNGVPYWYRLTGVNVLGLESEPTETVEVVPRPLRPPPPPADLEGREAGRGVLLEWPGVDGAEGYAIYRSRDFEGPYERVAPPEGGRPLSRTSFLDLAAPAGAILWYQVTAFDRWGNESAPSPTVQILLPRAEPPAPPTGLRAEGTEEGIRLTWEPSPESELAGYLVERTTRFRLDKGEVVDAGPFFALGVDPVAEPRYLDPVPEGSETLYAYRVVALDAAWNPSEPTPPVAARRPDRTPPQPPFLERAVLEEDRIVLRWTPGIEPDLAGYRLFRAAGEEGAFEPVHRGLLAPEATTYEDRPPRAGERYRYRLTAVDEAGNESAPGPHAAVLFLDLVPPDPPTGLRVEPVEGGLRLTWTPPKADDVAWILVFRRVGDDGPWIQLGEVPSGEREVLDDRAVAGEAYRYRLQAVDAAWNRSEPSAEATGRLDPP